MNVIEKRKMRHSINLMPLEFGGSAEQGSRQCAVFLVPKNHKLAPGHTDQGASKKKTFLLVVVPFSEGNLEPIGILLYLDTKLS